MKLGYDIQALQTGSKEGGIGRYCLNLLKTLIRLYPDHEYILFANGLYPPKDIPLPRANNLYHDIIDYLPFHDLNVMNRIIQRIHYRATDLDLLHVLSPIEFRRTAVVSDGGKPGKTIVILYDLIPLIFQNLYLTSESIKNEYVNRLQNVTAADLILTISESSRKDAMNLLGTPPDKIITIGCSISENFCHIENLAPSLIQEMKRKYKIRNKFIFNLGSIDIRKNQKNLILAFSNLPPDLLDQYTLVIACNYSPEDTNTLRAFAENQLKDKVIFLHFCPDEDVNLLYNMCDLFVMPSLYEGFGLPVLEAMRCGAPAIASHTSSIPEITGRTDNLFDPNDTAGLTGLMVKVLRNKAYQEELRRYGMKRSKEFSWDKVARKTMEAYENFLNGGRTKHRKSNTPTPLGIVTTWNTKCGIANYSKYLLEHLNKKIAVKIFANSDCERNGPDGTNVFRCWERGYDKGDLTILCEEILRQGTEIVNIQYNFGFFGVKQLGDLIISLKKNNIRAVITFHATASADICGKLQSLGDIAVELRCADKILVHSTKDVERLKAFNVDKNVVWFPHGMFLFDDENRFVLRRKRNLLNSKIVASFGFLLPHKGMLELIESLPLLIDTYPDMLFLFVCALYPHPVSREYFEQCMKRVNELKLQDHVIFMTDYLDEKDIMKFLHLADMLVFPYTDTSESSSAAIRLAAGARRPIITSASPIFDDFKAEVLQIDSVEPKGIAKVITSLYENKEAYEKFTTSIIARGEKERWEVVAKKYKDILDEASNSTSDPTELKWLNVMDDISKELMTIEVSDRPEAIEVSAKEIYRRYLTEQTNI